MSGTPRRNALRKRILGVPMCMRTDVLLDAYAKLERTMIDATEIADSCARADIECHCLAVDSGDDLRWYDIRVTSKWEVDAIAQSVRYLTARGLIERHPKNAWWVRFTT